MKFFRFLPVVIMLALCGCASFDAQKNIDNAKRLRVGMTKEQVLAVMGEPVKDESFCRPDCWFYYRETNWLDGLVTEDECFPLVFKDGRLQGWGNEFRTRYRLENKQQAQGIAPQAGRK